MILLTAEKLGELLDDYCLRESMDALVVELVNGDISAAERIYSLVLNVVRQSELDYYD